MYPEIAFFIFKIKKGKKKVSWGCLPGDFFRSGMRALPMYDEDMFYDGFSNLLMKVKTYDHEQVNAQVENSMFDTSFQRY